MGPVLALVVLTLFVWAVAIWATLESERQDDTPEPRTDRQDDASQKERKAA